MPSSSSRVVGIGSPSRRDAGKDAEATLSRMQADAHALRLRASLLLMAASWMMLIASMASFAPYCIIIFKNGTLYGGYVEANAKLPYTPLVYVVTSICGVGNYLALCPNDLLLIRLNAAAQEWGLRFAFHGGLFLWCIFRLLETRHDPPFFF